MELETFLHFFYLIMQYIDLGKVIYNNNTNSGKIKT